MLLFVAVLISSPAIAAGALDVGVQLEPPNLDPTSGSAAATDEIVYANIFEGLTRINDDGTVSPALATHWDVSEDGRSFTFHLRKGVTFHDGAEFSANDVVFSFERAGASSSTNAQRTIFEKFSAITAIDSITVRIELSEPLAELPVYLGWGDAVIVSKSSVSTLANAPIGTGPFRFVRWRKGASLSLSRYDDYWGTRAKLDQINFYFIPDPSAAFAALYAGDVDGFPNYPAAENISLFERDERFNVIRGVSEGEVILAINNQAPPFDDIRVRRALSHAIDKQAFIDAGLFGFGTPIGSHFPPHHPSYLDLSERYPYDPDRAREYLAAAGYADQLSVTLTLPPPIYARRGGEIAAAYLEAVGIDVEIRNVEWAQWLSQVFTNKEFELTIVSHTEPLDIDIYARDDYYFGYKSTAFRDIIDATRTTINAADRNTLYQRAQQTIADDAVNVFIASGPKIGVWQRDVKDVWINAPVQANDFTRTDVAGRASLTEISADDITQRSSTPAFVAFLLIVISLLAWFSRAGPGFFITKVATLLATLMAATIIVFLLLEIIPGDPAQFMLGLNADTESLSALRAELNLDRPIISRYMDWVIGMAMGDFGTSYTYRVPVVELINERLWVTLPLAGIAFITIILIGIPAGVYAALNHRTMAGRFLLGLSQAGVATPNFWIAILLVTVFAIKFGWFAAGGFPGWQAGFVPAIKALTLPAIALAIPQSAILMQIMRSSMLNVANEDFMRTARSKGLTRSEVYFRHGLRNALIPVLTILGLQFAFLVAGSVIIENVFYLPGLGRMIFQAIAQRDLITIKGVVMVLIFIVVMTAFLIDLIYPIVDPRLRRKT